MNSLSATESYVSLYNALNLQPATALSLFFLTLARILPIVALAPFFGAPKTLPMTLRMMFGICLTAIFLPQNLMSTHTNIPYDLVFIGYMVKELLIGSVIGLIAMVPFLVAQMSGSLIDHQRGASSLQVTDPTTQTQTGSIGVLYNYVLIALFFTLNGPFLFLDGVATSYQLIPVDGLISPAFFSLPTPFWKMVFNLHQSMMTLCIQLSAPALVGILLTDMFLGIANRLAPQVQIVFLGISLKSWVGIALMTAAWALIIKVMGENSISWVKMINQLITQTGTQYVVK